MMRDARTFDEDASVEADLCVIGGGMAGITIAREFAGHRCKVVVLESGGLDYDEATQALDSGMAEGDYRDVEYTRLRYLGGASNHWIGWCRPLDAVDFACRAWVPHSGWPIGREDLWPYYPRAFDYVQLGRFDDDAAHWLEPGERLLPFDADRFATCLYRFSPPTRFGTTYRTDLVAAPNIDLILNANVTDIETHSDLGHVTAVHAKTLEGRRFTVGAKTYVLACGGIENARLLLASDRQMVAGLGNGHDVVGRYFLDHPECHFGQVVLADGADAASVSRFYKRAQRTADPGGSDMQGLLRLAPAVQEREQLLNVECELLGESFAGSPGVRAARRLWREMRQGSRFSHLQRDIGWMLGDLGGLARKAATSAGLHLDEREPHHVVIHAQGEMAPDPENRVTLAGGRDALGNREPVVRVTIGDATKRSFLRAAQLLGEELGRTGLGRLYLHDADDSAETSRPYLVGVHHLGTTRMSDDPRRGVVDARQKVHGIDNLYIAGTSVFPTGGATYPSMNMVAMTLRLVDHLKSLA